MVVGTITPPLFLVGMMKFSRADAYPGSIARLASVFGTWLQGGGTRVTLEAPVVFELGDSGAQADDGAGRDAGGDNFAR